MRLSLQSHPYVLAAVTFALIFLIRLSLDRWLKDQSPYPLLLIAVAVTALYANARAALLVAALCAIGANFLFVPPRYHFGFATHGDIVALCTYIGAALAILLLVRARNTAASRAASGYAEAEALRNKLQAVVDAAPAAIVCFGLDRTVTSWNAAAELIFGWRADEIVGKPLPIPQHTQETWDTMRAALASGQSIANIETKRVRKDGAEIDVLLSDSPLIDANGTVTGFVGVIVDASEVVAARQQLEEAVARLRRSEEQLIQLAESIPQLAWMADDKGWIFWYNRRWFEYTGTTLEQMQGWGWRSVHHPDHVDRVVAKIQHCWNTGQAWEDTFPLRGNDGTYRWFLSRALPIRDQHGCVVRWFGTNTDITELRDAEEALRRAEAIAATGRMAHAMAHEINNPLEAVTNILFLLERDVSLSKMNHELVTSAATELARVSHIAKQTLSLYSHSKQRVLTDICEMLDATVNSCSQRIAGKQISIERRYSWNGQVEVLRNEIEEVFWNLLDNAIDAVERGGRIAIHVYPSRTRSGTPSDGIRVSIADNGRGIPEANRQKLFEPFATTTDRKGSGLGLWVIKDIVVRHGGTVHIKTSTRPGRAGTCCAVFLPLNCLREQIHAKRASTNQAVQQPRSSYGGHPPA